MNDAFAVCVGDGFGDGDHVWQKRQTVGQRWSLLDHLLEGSTGHQLHRVERGAARPIAGLVNRHDGRMLQMSGDHRFAEKAAGQLRAAVKQLFDRNVAAKAPVVGLENPPECASSHLPRDCISAGRYDRGLGLPDVGRQRRRILGLNAWLFGLLRGSKLDRRREPNRSCLRPRMSLIRLVVPGFPVRISAPTHETPAFALSPRNENKSLADWPPFC